MVPGARVQATGEGQTAGWKGWKGTVVRVTDDGRILVELGPDIEGIYLMPNEVRPEVKPLCPCARCGYHS